MIARLIDRWERTGRDTRHCELEGCRKATNGRKPYCTKHLTKMPYVRQVQQRILDRQAEWDRVEATGSRAVNAQGITAREILEYVKIHGPCTVRRLSKDLSMGRELLDPYVKSLRRKSHIRLTANNRGVPVVHFLEVQKTICVETQAA